MKKLLFIFITLFLAFSCDYIDRTSVEKIEIGMSKDEVFKILGEREWNDYNDYGFKYKWSFSSSDMNHNKTHKIFCSFISY